MTVTTPTTIDTKRLRQVFAAHPSGVTALATLVDGTPRGLLASTFTAVSLQPALVSLCIAESSTTWPLLRTATHLGLSVLAAHQHDVGRSFAGPSDSRFDTGTWRRSPEGAMFLDGASAWFETTPVDIVPAGDHHILLLSVQDLDIDEAVPPLVFHGSSFRHLAPEPSRRLRALR